MCRGEAESVCGRAGGREPEETRRHLECSHRYMRKTEPSTGYLGSVLYGFGTKADKGLESCTLKHGDFFFPWRGRGPETRGVKSNFPLFRFELCRSGLQCFRPSWDGSLNWKTWKPRGMGYRAIQDDLMFCARFANSSGGDGVGRIFTTPAVLDAVTCPLTNPFLA